MKKILSVLLVCLIAASTAIFCACDPLANYKAPKYAQVYATTGTMSKLLARDTSLEFSDYDEDSYNVSVKVSTDKSYQNYYGNGAALTHASAYLLMQDEDTRAEMLREFFSKDGAYFNMVRVPIGASDYIDEAEFFSCCDLNDPYDEDMALTSFNLDHDANIIAVLKEILAINPDIQIIAVPWSAPAWMKQNHSLIGGNLDETYNATYADYLLKFVQEYKKQGITISWLSLLNEPGIFGVKYPSMNMGGAQAAEIIKILGKNLQKADLDVKIMAWDHNVDNSDYFLEDIYNDEEVAKYVTGTAFHAYGGSYVTGCENHTELFPGKEMFLTELTEHSGSNDFAANLSFAAQNVSVAPVNVGSGMGLFWNLVLRKDGTPTPVSHGANVCYGVMEMNELDGGGFEYNKNASYYAMAHISKFAYAVDGTFAKALRVESSNDATIMACALLRADGAVVVCVTNVSDVLSEDVDIVIDGKCVTYKVQPQSVVTFVC
ncbi:MAG: hypothetical protein NC132_05085 [Corallococcus sp.]|nr:hypothetical protein [Corallococcus sp.]MCM1360141.1 hypothetical protein [Corallococcus sp.]MCM1395471.1 hypothetical protein [Corallococcus sp.]